MPTNFGWFNSLVTFTIKLHIKAYISLSQVHMNNINMYNNIYLNTSLLSLRNIGNMSSLSTRTKFSYE